MPVAQRAALVGAQPRRLDRAGAADGRPATIATFDAEALVQLRDSDALARQARLDEAARESLDRVLFTVHQQGAAETAEHRPRPGNEFVAVGMAGVGIDAANPRLHPDFLAVDAHRSRARADHGTEGTWGLVSDEQ